MDLDHTGTANRHASPNPAETATIFFKAVFACAPADTALILLTPPTWRPHQVDPTDPAAAARTALTFGTDTFVGVGLQAAAPVAPRRTAGAVVALTAVTGDLDVEKPGATKRYLPDRATARRFLADLPITPTVLAWSGRGYQPWWCFRELMLLDTPDARARAARLIKRWQGYLRLRLNGYELDSTHDLSRVLRVPGLVNSKYNARVELEFADGPRVDPSELEDLCIDVPEVTRKGSAPRVSPPAPAPVIDPTAEPPADKLAALCRLSVLFRRLWLREIAPRDTSQSGFDLRLASYAAGHGWSDRELVALMIAHRRAGGRPPKPEAYYSRTVAMARAAARQVAAPGRSR